MCDFDYDFYYATERNMRCRKARRCVSCGWRVPAGEVVQRSFGSDGGTPVVDFRCMTCVWMAQQDDGSFLHICDRELRDDGTNQWKWDYVNDCLADGRDPSPTQALAIGKILGLEPEASPSGRAGGG